MEALNGVVDKHPRWGFWMCYDRLHLLAMDGTTSVCIAFIWP